MAKIGLFGGTFNPIHKAHINIGKEVLNKMNLDAIVYIPSGNPPHKEAGQTSGKQRYDMVRLAIDGIEGLYVSDFEIKKEKPCYSVETISHFLREYPNDEFVFIIGEDSLDYIEKWYRADELLKLCAFVALGRGGYESDIEKKIKYLKDEFFAEVSFLKTEEMDVSSSEIRSLIRDKKDVSRFLTKEVLDYILENKLYI